jgi:hypothetical protein
MFDEDVVYIPKLDALYASNLFSVLLFDQLIYIPTSFFI